MKVCIREESEWRNISSARVEFTQREIKILASGGPDVYLLPGGEVVVLPEPEASIRAHEPIEVK